MKFKEEVDRLRLLEYLLHTCGIIILGSISALFDKDDTYSVQKHFYKRFYHTRYLFYLFITLFMIMLLIYFFLLLKVELIMKI